MPASKTRPNPYVKPHRERKIVCGLCRYTRDEGPETHPELGPLCVGCSTLLRNPGEPTCPLCFDGSCPIHHDRPVLGHGYGFGRRTRGAIRWL